MHTRQPDRVFALAAAQLKHDGILVMEKLLVPLPLKRESFVHNALIGILEQVPKGLVLGKSF